MTRRVIVSGSRDWPWSDRAVIEGALDLELMVAEFLGDRLIVIQGGARGADSIAAEWARVHHVDCETYCADWDTFGRAAGHIRNAEMVKRGADIVLGFPIGASKGTRGCMELARKAGIQVEDHGYHY